MTMFFEISATILGVIQSVLIMQNKRSNWIAYVLQMLFLMLFSFSVSLYGDVINCVVYLFLGFWGFLLWNPQKQELKISTYTNYQRIYYLLLLIIISALFYAYLIKTDDPFPFIDSITTSSSFIATYFMVMRKLEAWVVWFFNDILYVLVYFLLKEQAWYLLSLNIIWTFMAVFSFWNWKKIMEKPNA